MRNMNLVRYTLLCATSVLFLAPLLPAAEIISNGGFESGLTGWTTANAPGSDGSFFLQTGTSSPVNAFTVPAPIGATAAMTDAEGPGSHILYQDFTLTAPVGSAVLTFASYIGNGAGAFSVPTPNTLDFGVAAFNQQARVDILRASASPFSVDSANILANVFQTNPGSSAGTGYTIRSADLTSVLNSNLNTLLRLRFAEVDNVSTFQFGVDNVSLETNPVPEPSSVLIAGLGLLLLCTCIRWGRRSCRLPSGLRARFGKALTTNDY